MYSLTITQDMCGGGKLTFLAIGVNTAFPHYVALLVLYRGGSVGNVEEWVTAGSQVLFVRRRLFCLLLQHRTTFVTFVIPIEILNITIC
jgi:hypothetical protein